MLHLLPMPPTCMALSDTGLCAVASGGLLAVADARSQEMVVRAGFGAHDFFSRQIGDREARIVAAEAHGEIAALTFAVCRIAEDRMLAPRLIVVRTSGYVTVWTFEQGSLGDWFGFRSAGVQLDVKGPVLTATVLDPSGQPARCTADEVQRARIEQESPDGGMASSAHHFHLLLVVTERCATMRDQITGPRIGHADLPDKADGAQVVSRPHGRVLLTVSPSSITALTLPRLDTAHRIQRHVPPSLEVVAAPPKVSIEAQGDFAELSDGQQLRIWTAFATQPHGEMPNMCLFTPRPLPYAPGVGAGGYIASLGQWLGTAAVSTLSPGAQLDAVLGGSRRPPQPKLPPRVSYVPDVPVVESPPPSAGAAPGGKAAPGKGTGTATPPADAPRESWLSSYQRSLTSLANGSARSQAQINMQLLHKRDEILAKYVAHALTQPRRGDERLGAQRKGLPETVRLVTHAERATRHSRRPRATSLTSTRVCSEVAHRVPAHAPHKPGPAHRRCRPAPSLSLRLTPTPGLHPHTSTMAPHACRTALEAVAASAADLDACYAAWNAHSYGWHAGPVFACGPATQGWSAVVDGQNVHVASPALWRVALPIRADAALPSTPHPLAGLATFRNAVDAELRFLERIEAGTTAESASNARYLVAFWAEVLYTLLTRGTLLALNAEIATRTRTVRISIVAPKQWIRLVPIRRDALRAEFREADALLDLDDLPQDDSAAIEQSSIWQIACDVVAAADAQAQRPALTLALVRLDERDADMAPAPSGPAYWHASEDARFAWRLAALVRRIRALHIDVRFGPRNVATDTPTVADSYPALPRPPTLPTLRATPTLNLDTSALIALVSDLSHARPGPDMEQRLSSHSNRALAEQYAYEQQSPLCAALAEACAPVTHLVASPTSLAKMQQIVHKLGSDDEQRRAAALCHGNAVQFWAGSRWDASPISTQLVLPITREVDASHSYAGDATTHTLASHMRTALQAAATSSARAKTLGASPHTVEALELGLDASVTTLTSHANGVQQLAAATTDALDSATHLPPYTGAPTTAALWLVRPRSLCGPCATGSEAPSPPVKPVADVEDMARVSEGSDVPSSPSSTQSPPMRAPRTRLARLVRWIIGPPYSTLRPIQHYPWWPFGALESRFEHATAALAWRPPPPQSHLPAWLTPDDEAFELLPPSTPRASPPTHRGALWLSRVHATFMVNRVHYIALVCVCVAWLFGFAVLVDRNWFHAEVETVHGWTSPQYVDCTSTYWLRNAACGLDGAKCAPFEAPAQPFRCPSGCASTILLNPRTVGDAQYNYQPLVVGGGPHNATSFTPYRADSFICAAAQHAGVLGSGGGCASLRLTGAYANFTASTAHGIESFPFAGTFPSSYVLERVNGRNCADTRWKTYVLDAVFSAIVGLVVRPQPIVLLFILAIVGYWHVNLVSELRDFPPPVGEAAGDFGPHLFVTYAAWRIAIRYVWPAFAHVPLEFGIGTLGLWWLGVLLDVVFADVPLQRLEGHDITQQPGALPSLIVIIIVVVCVAINQVRVIRAAGCLPKYLALYIIAGVAIGLCATVPGEGVRLHHYIIGIALLPACGFPTRISLLCCAFLFGMYTNGVARWGFDGLIQDESVIQGDATGSSALPAFAVPPTTGSVVHWDAIPAALRATWDSFVLLVDDVVRYQGSGTQFDLNTLYSQYNTSGSTDSPLLGTSTLTSALANTTHYLRLAYASAGSPGDFTMPALMWMNGTFVPPPAGRT